MTSATYPLSGLHCQSCVEKIAKELHPLAAQVTVSLHPPQVLVVDAKVPTVTLQAAVARAGKYSLSVSAEEDATASVSLAATPSETATWFETYQPLLLLVGYIGVASVLIQIGLGQGVSTHETMRYFMAGFFGAFSFFKLLNVREFASAYARYDLLAAKWPAWGLVYPFVEMSLGISYLGNLAPVATNWITLLVMGFSALGVIRAVRNKAKIQCACLGAVLKLPMSTVTIIEDLGMTAMAAYMLAASSSH